MSFNYLCDLGRLKSSIYAVMEVSIIMDRDIKNKYHTKHACLQIIKNTHMYQQVCAVNQNAQFHLMHVETSMQASLTVMVLVVKLALVLKSTHFTDLVRLSCED